MLYDLVFLWQEGLIQSAVIRKYFSILIDVISSCMLYCSDGVAHDAGAVNEGRRHDGSNSHVHRAKRQQDELVRTSLLFLIQMYWYTLGHPYNE